MVMIILTWQVSQFQKIFYKFAEFFNEKVKLCFRRVEPFFHRNTNVN